MKDNNSEKPKPVRKIPAKRITPKPPKFNFMWVYALVIATFIGIAVFSGNTGGRAIDFKTFDSKMLKNGDVDYLMAYKSGDLVVAEVHIKKDSLEKKAQYAAVRKAQNAFNVSNNDPQYAFNAPSYEMLKQSVDSAQKGLPALQKIEIRYDQRDSILSNGLVQSVIMIVLFAAVLMFIMRRMSGGAGGGPGGQIFNIGKSKATLFDKESQVSVTFNDVAGLEEAKQEVMEIVDFLRNPKKYTNLGGKIPKGALLVGSPGTGKTLLAKAVAGEAQVPFFSLSGSDFVEMFVGVGASRVRDLFARQKTKRHVSSLLTRLMLLAVPVVKTIL